jgi:hypothetical protein
VLQRKLQKRRNRGRSRILLFEKHTFSACEQSRSARRAQARLRKAFKKKIRSLCWDETTASFAGGGFLIHDISCIIKHNETA